MPGADLTHLQNNTNVHAVDMGTSFSVQESTQSIVDAEETKQDFEVAGQIMKDKFYERPHTLLRYPEDLGLPTSVDNSIFGKAMQIFDSGKSHQDTPYIEFEIYDQYLDFIDWDQVAKDINDASVKDDGELDLNIDNLGNIAALTMYTDAELRQMGKLNETKRFTIALYMTPSISISDGVNFETSERALLAGLKTPGDFTRGDLGMLMSHSLSGALTTGGIASFLGGSKVGKMLGVGLAALGAPTKVIGDEYIRLTGDVKNPNEYLHFKNTTLRTFEFSFKFLPNSVNESKQATAIIQAFRSSMRPVKKTQITQGSPLRVRTSFKGVDDMIKIPPSYISNATVNYNPNSASFFRKGGSPVEIDFNISLQEILPIFRGDVEGKTYPYSDPAGLLAEGFTSSSGGY